ncbi:flagellar biosynthesis protein FlhB [Sulfurospirillum multivorans]|uniref:Flagellar biosynthetic protein FlhB n=2 Tax=Sulfurospirillum multivorans TaxID=66821 RepID=A0AA86AJ27_SULMK|nr:flagellar biosynthesis protein FlhB [Sulfurospirillum multivorans]AHJ11601.1 flagellar biosynthesis protein FlhB [Sulfurospirillum multivorans DSM 12446]QEH05101.1 flagellar biosynthesis protein FlhB [Sulfurospirillum multivorans]
MADDQEKTEEPSSKKIDDARKDGNVPKSQDTNAFVTLVVALVAFLALLPWIESRIVYLYFYYQSLIGTEITKEVTFQISMISFREVLFMVIPLSLAVAISGILANVMQTGFIFTTKPLIPDLSKLDPMKGLKNLFSMKKAVESIKIIIKVSVILWVCYYFLLSFTKELPTVIYFPLYDQLAWLKEKMLILIAVILLLFLVIALADLMFVRYNYFKSLRMSKQELKDEYKQMEGDPKIKAKIRQIQMQMTRKRMMQEIPQADVVITNPTHYAVAIRYNQEKEAAPKVIAKGTDYIALRIKEIAMNYNIQIVENPPLARELYKKCNIGEIIPENLYKAVAEVLAFVYKSSKKMR